MRQPSKTVTPAQASQTRTLHPVLQSTLANLDIQLEEELARYRRQRTGGRQGPRPMGQRQSSPKPLDLISVSASASQPSSLQSNPLPSKLTESHPSRVGSATAEAPLQKPSEEVHDRTPINLAIASPVSEEQLAVERTANELSNLLGTMTVSEDRSALSANHSGLEDYLESSEDLLRSLAEEEAQVQAERGFMESLLTPLGVGSMLLLLLSSAMFGYVIMNPSSLNRFFAARNPNAQPSPSTATSEASPTLTPSNASTQAGLPGPQPNLTAQEFKDLNLRTLGTLKPNAAATLPGTQVLPSTTGTAATLSTNLGATGNTGASVPATASTATQSPSASTSAPSGAATPQGSTRPDTAGAASTPRSSAPTTVSQPAPAQSYKPAPATPPASRADAEDYRYKIVVHYDSDRTLEDAKKAVPDAYVRNFNDGAKIQLGAFSSAADAESRVQELRRQGISAEVYKR